MRKSDLPKTSPSPSSSPLRSRIEVEVTTPQSNSYPAQMEKIHSEVGIDSSVVKHIEELLEEIELQECRFTPIQNGDEDFTSVFKKVVEIERKLKRFEAESMALKKLLQRLN